MLKEFDYSDLIRGTLISRYIKCKKKNCPCQNGGKVHGPNWYLVVSENSKTKHIYIPKDKVIFIKKGIKIYHKLRKDINRISKKNIIQIKKGAPS